MVISCHATLWTICLGIFVLFSIDALPLFVSRDLSCMLVLGLCSFTAILPHNAFSFPFISTVVCSFVYFTRGMRNVRVTPL